MSRLNDICNFLIECGLENVEIRSDRKDPYVNFGNVKRVNERMQFWIPRNGRGIEMYVGTKMGKWYIESSKSPYLVYNGRYSEIENKVVFPSFDLMKDFVSRVSKL